MDNITPLQLCVAFVVSFVGGALIWPYLSTNQPARSYWVWAFEDLDYVEPKSELILYQGTVSSEWQFMHRGLFPFQLEHEGPVKALLRLDTLGDPKDVARQYLHIKDNWLKHGVHIGGLQIDHDSPSSKLIQYSKWLMKLKKQLPMEAITITSLVTHIEDSPSDFEHLASVVDSVSIQLYQGYDPHDHIERIIAFLYKRQVTHKIGITTSPGFKETEKLCLEFCEGIVVFLNKQGEGS